MTLPAFQSIDIRRDAHVAEILLNRADSHNSVTHEIRTFVSEDVVEAIDAFREKRKPHYLGR